jgi:hypothetical protein
MIVSTVVVSMLLFWIVVKLDQIARILRRQQRGKG